MQRALLIGAKPSPMVGPRVYVGDFEDWGLRIYSDAEVPTSAIRVYSDGDYAQASILHEFDAAHVTVIAEAY